MHKCIAVRHIKNALSKEKFAKTKGEPLPIVIYKHNSLIRRKLGNVDLQLQENKAVNLGLAAPKITGIIIKPGETFSLWKLIGSCTKRKGYKEGLTIAKGDASKGIGGGMCQLSNLIHWMILHSDLKITEHHHHDGLDLFPDFQRKIYAGSLPDNDFHRLRNGSAPTNGLLFYADDWHFLFCRTLYSPKGQ